MEQVVEVCDLHCFFSGCLVPRRDVDVVAFGSQYASKFDSNAGIRAYRFELWIKEEDCSWYALVPVIRMTLLDILEMIGRRISMKVIDEMKLNDLQLERKVFYTEIT